jgi:4-hydroxybenzoate polyprenyltransferase
MNTTIENSISPPGLQQRVRLFLEMIKFSHSIFALPFALTGAFLAARQIGLWWPGWTRLGLILLCMVSARTFAMTFNRLADREIDRRNPRTARRPSVTGEVSVRFMLASLLLSALLFVLSTWLFDRLLGNIYPVILSLPVLAWIALYSFAKRFTWLCHFFLGASLGLAPVSAWIAIVPPHGPALGIQILILGIAVLFWTAGFDILYALQDASIDRQEKLFSIPASIGIRGSLWISRLCHAITMAALLLFGLGLGSGMALGTLYWIGFAAVALLLIIEQSLVKPGDISRVNLAFMSVNGVVGVVFGTLSIAAILVHR